MDPLKDLIEMQKQFLENIVPKKYLEQFENFMSNYKDIDPGIFLKHFKDTVESLTGQLPGLKLDDFYKNLQQNSDKLINLFKSSLENPMKFFEGFLGKNMVKPKSKPSSAPKSGTSK